MSRVSCSGRIIVCVMLVLGTQAAWPVTYFSSDTPQTANPISSKIVVPDNLMVEKVTVTIEELEALESIPYLDYSSGIHLNLQSPSNMPSWGADLTINNLSRWCTEANPCTYEHTYENLTFGDFWGYIDGFTNLAPDSGVGTQNQLDWLFGQNCRGTWTLNVSMPAAPLSMATLTGWSLTIEGCEENPEGCPKPVFDGVYEAGQDLCLCVPCPVSDTSAFAWSKDGVPLADDARVFGANERTLYITALETGDAGLYSCTYEDGSKAPKEYEAEVKVVTEVPLLSQLGILALTVTCGLLGAFARRRQA